MCWQKEAATVGSWDTSSASCVQSACCVQGHLMCNLLLELKLQYLDDVFKVFVLLGCVVW